MTFDEAIAKAATHFDTVIADQIEHYEIFLSEMGGTEDEVAKFILKRKADLEQWKADALAETRRALSDWDAPSGKLQ